MKNSSTYEGLSGFWTFVTLLGFALILVIVGSLSHSAAEQAQGFLNNPDFDLHLKIGMCGVALLLGGAVGVIYCSHRE